MTRFITLSERDVDFKSRCHRFVEIFYEARSGGARHDIAAGALRPPPTRSRLAASQKAHWYRFLAFI